ncbi:hypothetical protein M9H77_09425 [Catharanthus roseus]|uniref:Uncharacterized protein n=1 Tax=Catharanthus roseus TaxID=4058 RepID=A0ACC0C0P7_CATRO|nr:hypothetical protein M9H77_09425 [Catharanthus roseus]
MAVILHYVNKRGAIVERFVGIVHVSDTTALSLNRGIESSFCKHGLSLCRIRGQEYRKLAICKNHVQVASLFSLITTIQNVVGDSCKRHDILCEKQIKKVKEALYNGEILSGQ